MCLINNSKQINIRKIMINPTSMLIKALMLKNKYKEMQVFQTFNEEKEFNDQICLESMTQ